VLFVPFVIPFTMTCVLKFICSFFSQGSFYNHEIHERHERKRATVHGFWSVG